MSQCDLSLHFKYAPETSRCAPIATEDFRDGDLVREFHARTSYACRELSLAHACGRGMAPPDIFNDPP